MNTAIAIFILAILSNSTSSENSTSNHDGRSNSVYDPLYGRNGLLNFLPFANQVTREEFSALSTNIAALVNTLTRLLPRCPSSAPLGSQIIGQHCYYVYTAPDNYNNARATCNTNGGILSEPLPQNSPAFYNIMRTVFPAQFAIIGNRDIWIGLLQPSIAAGAPSVIIPPFVYLSNNIQVPLPSIFVGLSQSSNTNGAAIKTPGTTWTSYDATLAVNVLPFICQYDTVH